MITFSKTRDVDNEFDICGVEVKSDINYIDIKEISSTHRQYEFFIDKKFKLHEFDEQSDIFKEITNINQIWFKDEWGQNHFFSVSKYSKRINFDERYEVIKFIGTVVEAL